MKITLNWVNRNTDEDGTRVYRATAPFTTVDEMTPIATLPQGANTYVDETVVKGQLYYYRLQVFKDGDWYLGNQVAITALAYSGPGPQELSKGDYERGYFGEVTYDKLLSGDELALATGLTAGTSINPLTPWLKFAHKGKILFIPKLPIRQVIAYNSLYDAGLVYGVDGPGAVVPNGRPQTNQKKLVEIQGDQFLVRLMKGAASNPAVFTATLGGGDATGVDGSEWNDLILSLTNTVPPSQTWGNFLNVPDADILGTVAQTTLCQEAGTTVGTSLVRGAYRSTTEFYPAGITLINIASTTGNTVMGGAYVNRNFCWRPVLEFQP